MANSLREHNYYKIDATVIGDSVNVQGDRLTTLVITFPRMILAELNTHRMLSRNSASSRAIPFKTMLSRVSNYPFIPIAFQKEHKGMQGSEYVEGIEKHEAEAKWLQARNHATEQAKKLNDHGVTKQLANRILEPFLWHTVIVSATEWNNFFNLRDHSAAEIHIQALAREIKQAMNMSTPQILKENEWHIPFGDNIDYSEIEKIKNEHEYVNTDELTKKIAIARCARVSYSNFDKTFNYKKDIALYDKLANMGHWSPFEHVAKAMSKSEYESFIKSSESGWCNNFKGFIQSRFIKENKLNQYE